MSAPFRVRNRPRWPSVLAVVGPTASGKTALAIELAERLGTEVISADSMQVYKGLEIGTGAPTPEQQRRVKHHFISFLDPREPYSAGAFGEAARAVVGELNARGKVAVVVGGSGLYVQALIDGLFPGPGKNESIRLRLHEEATKGGPEPLYRRLQATDPDYARVVRPGDIRRIVRGLEVYELTGQPISKLHEAHRNTAPVPPAVQVALDYARKVLYERINCRVDRMLEMGFLAEVRALIDRGYFGRLGELRALGYLELASYLRGERSLEDAIETTKRNTRRYAKRQLSWFRHDDRITWLPAGPDNPPTAFLEKILALLP